MRSELLAVSVCLAWLALPIPSGIAQVAARDVAVQQELDQAVKGFMQRTGATAATVAISRHGEIIWSDSWGFSDRPKQLPATVTTTMRLASCTKPVTRAAIEQLIAQGKLERETLVYDFLGISPGEAGLADPRVKLITIDHLMNHRGGWDRDATFDPLYQTDQIKRELGVGYLQKNQIVKYMWGYPLQFDPGSQVAYSNFGYLLLGLIIEKVTGKSYILSIRELVGDPLGIDDFAISSAVKSARSPNEVYYPDDNGLSFKLRDSASGLVSSSESMCRFLGAWWIDGLPRDDYRAVYLYHFGTHPLTTSTIMEQRLDGIDYAMMFNSRRESSYDEDNRRIREEWNEILDRVARSLGD